jgi:Flp pilus assembly protein TadG
MSLLSPQVRRAGDRGATSIEFAVVIPMLVMLLFAGMDISLTIAGSTAGSNAAHEGARIGSVAYLDADVSGSANNRAITEAVRHRIGPMVMKGTSAAVDVRCLDGASAAVTRCDGGAAVDEDLIEVSVRWRPIVFSGLVGGSSHVDTARSVLMNDGDLSAHLAKPGTSELSLADLSVTETDANQVVHIALSRSGGTGAVAVGWATHAGTAKDPDDYIGGSGVVNLSSGQTAMDIDVTVVGDDVPSEGVETFTVVLSSPVNATLADGSATVSIIDDDVANTPPHLVAFEMLDDDADARVDRLDAVFDETLSGGCASASAWTLTNVPSSGTKGAVTISGNRATLAINEGTGAQTTAVGTLTAALAAGAVCDSASTPSAAVAARAPLDRAGPVLLTWAETDGTTNGRFQALDTLSLSMSEPILASSLPSLTTVTLADGDTIAAPGVLLGSHSLGASSYISNNKSATFEGSGVALVAASTVRITLAACATNCNKLLTATSAASATLAVATSISDASGNGARGAAVVRSVRMF